jgi:hypothetical protein
MKTSGKWPRPQYQHPDGQIYTDNEIFQSWKTMELSAQQEGTKLHQFIENFFYEYYPSLSRTKPLPTISPSSSSIESDTSSSDISISVEIQQFLEFYEHFFTHYQIQPILIEFPMVAPNDQFAGSLDFLGQSLLTGEYYLMDWKRSKKLHPNTALQHHNKYAK